MFSRPRWKLTVPLLAALALATLSAPQCVQAQSGFRVVVHPDNPVESLTETELSRLFLKKITTWPDGRKVEPVDQSETAETRMDFSQRVHGREVGAIRAYWNKLIFAGRGLPPPELDGDREVLTFVRSHPRSIGYVSPGTDTSGVKVVRIQP